MCAIVIIFTVLTLHVGTSLASPQINTKLFRTPPVVGAPIYTKLFHTPPVVGATISKPNADLEDHVAPTNATDGTTPNLKGSCVSNGETYYDGEEITTSAPCQERCICKNGSTSCAFVSCPTAPPAFLRCSPLTVGDECCPKFDCPPVDPSIPESPECVLEGIQYQEGGFVPSPDLCTNCYCIEEKIVCAYIDCPSPLEICKPISLINSTSCCPHKYECDDMEVEPTTSLPTEIISEEPEPEDKGSDASTLAPEVSNEGTTDITETDDEVDCNPTCQRGTCNGPNECSCTTSWSSDRCNKEFYEAASTGDLGYIQGELSSVNSSGLRLNWKNQDGWTALHIAANTGHALVVRALMEAGASPNRKDDYGQTPVHLAAAYGHTAVLRTLLEPKYQADVNLQGEGGRTPVYLAAQYGHTAVLRTLLEPKYQADVNLQERSGWTPVHTAARYGQTAALEVLVAHGADVNLQQEDGWTPVHTAAGHGQTAALEVLVAHGADVDKVTITGDSPLHAASGRGHVGSVRALINAGAQVDYADPSYGWTALHYAAQGNHADVARLLLQHGADKRKQDKRGDTAADWSRKYGDGSVARIIDKY